MHEDDERDFFARQRDARHHPNCRCAAEPVAPTVTFDPSIPHGVSQ